MRISDSTLVVSAIFQVAEKNGTGKVSPGMVTSFVTQQFGVAMPLHQVLHILRDLDVVTYKVGHNPPRTYIAWNDEHMSHLKQRYTAAFNAATNETGSGR